MAALKSCCDFLITWVTCAEQKLEYVGVYAHELEQKNMSFAKFSMAFDEVDHACEMTLQVIMFMQRRITRDRIASGIPLCSIQTEITRCMGGPMLTPFVANSLKIKAKI